VVNHSRRSRAEWDEFARPTSSRRHRVLGRVGLSAVTAGVVGFGLSVALVPLVVALLVGAAAASAVGVVLLRLCHACRVPFCTTVSPASRTTSAPSSSSSTT
jgi:hypothetical protein